MIIDHIGIIVDDIDETLTRLKALFDLEVDEVKDMPEVGLRVAHIRAKNVQMELLQYSSDEPGFAQEVMGRESGINHISIRVDDIQAAVERMKRAGAKLKEGFPRRGSRGVIAFFEPESTGGILFEICEHG